MYESVKVTSLEVCVSHNKVSALVCVFVLKGFIIILIN